jgi:hypothetical protein
LQARYTCDVRSTRQFTTIASFRVQQGQQEQQQQQSL